MEAKRDLQSVFDSYLKSYLASDADGAAKHYTSDATVFSPFGPPVCGHENLKEMHLKWFEEGEINKKVEVLEAQTDGDIGYCTAKYSADLPQDDGSLIHEKGTSLNTFQRQADGTWKIQHTSLNTLEIEE